MPQGRLPLEGMRVIDVTDGVAAVAGRLLADMGADVVLVEPPEGMASRRAQPRHDGHGLRFATEHFNKRGIVLLKPIQSVDKVSISERFCLDRSI